MNHSYNVPNTPSMNHHRNYAQPMPTDTSARISRRRASFERHDSVIFEELSALAGGTSSGKGGPRTKGQTVGNDQGEKISLQVTKGKGSDKKVAPSPKLKLPSTISSNPVGQKEPEDRSLAIFEELETLANSKQHEKDDGRRSEMPKQESSSAMSAECHDSLILEDLIKNIGIAADPDDNNDTSITLEDLKPSASTTSPSTRSDAHAHSSPKRQRGYMYDEDLIDEVIQMEGLLSDKSSSSAISIERHDSVIFEELDKELDEGAKNDNGRSIIMEDLMHRSRRRTKRRRRQRSSIRAQGAAPSAISFEGHDSLIFEEISKELEGDDDDDDCDKSITLEDLREDMARTHLLSAASRFEQSVIDKNLSSGNLAQDGFHFSFRF